MSSPIDSFQRPIKIVNVTWQCPHCLTEYDDYQVAEACSRHPRVEPKYKVGDTVYVPLRYPTDDGKKTCPGNGNEDP